MAANLFFSLSIDVLSKSYIGAMLYDFTSVLAFSSVLGILCYIVLMSYSADLSLFVVINSYLAIVARSEVTSLIWLDAASNYSFN